MSETPTYKELEQKTRILEQVSGDVQSQKSMIASEQLWHSVALASPDFILITDQNGIIQHINRTPPGLFYDKIIGSHINNYIAPEYHGQTKKALDQVFLESKNGTYQIKWEGPGSTSYYKIHYAPIKGEGQVAAAAFLANDISQQKIAEKELAEAQKELIEKAHKAGMAEIASGTLHNVGNILNSVNSSVEIVGDIISGTSLHGFKKANNLLRKNIDSLEDFIINNPKGKKLMQYYLKLEEGFSNELDTTNKHITRLKNKVRAIEDVIYAQQSYASSQSMSEEYNLSEIIEDALTMQSGTIGRYNLTVTKEFHNVPKVTVQKIKLMHTLINIIQNAKDAMIDSSVEQRNLTISVDANDEATFIRVKDTGAGIIRENTEKIFSHGFTTKKTGHGFGLNSSANYIREMGGRMWAESEGKGKGATFILRFPRKEPINESKAEKLRVV